MIKQTLHLLPLIFGILFLSPLNGLAEEIVVDMSAEVVIPGDSPVLNCSEEERVKRLEAFTESTYRVLEAKLKAECNDYAQEYEKDFPMLSCSVEFGTMGFSRRMLEDPTTGDITISADYTLWCRIVCEYDFNQTELDY